MEDDTKDVFSRSISKLISLLITAFRMKEFDEVEEIFISIELMLKKELENNKKENELLEAKYELLRNEKASIEAQLCEVKGKAELLLNPLNNYANEVQNGDKRVVEGYEKFSKELKTKGRPELDEGKTIFELRDRNFELELSKKTAEDDLEVWKKRFQELETQVSILEIKLPLDHFSVAPAIMVGENVDSLGNGPVSDVIMHIINTDNVSREIEEANNSREQTRKRRKLSSIKEFSE